MPSLRMPIEPPVPIVTESSAGIVTVIPFGMVTLPDDRGTVPPQVAGSFQLPLCTAVNVDGAVTGVIALAWFDADPVPNALIADTL